MKVKKLISILQTFDPELEVGVLHDNGVVFADEVGVYEGNFNNRLGNKMIYKKEKRQFVVVGNPGDFDNPSYHDNCKPVKVVDEYE